MKKLIWQPDPVTLYWAKTTTLTLIDRNQADNDDYFYEVMTKRFNPSSWKKYILKPDFPEFVFKENSLNSCPSNIMECFKRKQYLEGLVLTVIWGNMVRTANKIYQKDLKTIQEELAKLPELIEESSSIESSWNVLTQKLGWSKVMSSKYLHFLTRSMGYEQNHPVAIDNRAIIDGLWPALVRLFKEQGDTTRQLPKPWNTDDSFETFNRYMTLINYWAELCSVPNIRVEVTLFMMYV
ncbi:MAG: hypothetical protein H7A25_21145 [Leptospiraceae bacterium]|nr:hypothetical protein [Leptospiraceae bacterium]MCP5502417.1 hypothetical protein [Leptospiraceae bacterium]